MMTTVATNRLLRLMAPASLTVIGASSSREWATGNQVLRNLRAAGYTGEIKVVNSSGTEIEGHIPVESIAHAGPTDTAVVSVRGETVLSVLNELHAVGTPTAAVLSVGLTPDELTTIGEFSQRTGMAVHGPNCMGLINVRQNTMIWADEGILLGLPHGNIGIISQSGSGAIFVARSTSGVGFSHIVSTGNEAGLTTTDYLEALIDDADTQVIGLILESIHDPAGFSAAIRRAKTAGKWVVALKVGVSAAGARATIAHTGAMIADDTLIHAFFERAAVPLVADYDELASTLDLLSRLDKRQVGRGRVAAVSLSGGQAALAADLADAVGVPLASLSDETSYALSRVLPGSAIDNPLDAGASTATAPTAWKESLTLLAADDDVDVVIAVLDAQSTLSDVEIDYEEEHYRDFQEFAKATAKPAVVVSSSSLTLHPRRVPTEADAAPVIRGIRNAYVAIRAASIALSPSTDDPIRHDGLPDSAEILRWRSQLLQSGGRIDADTIADLLSAYGLQGVRSTSVVSADEAAVWARAVGYPIVLKVDSPDVPHRSDIGAVVVGIEDEAGLRNAWSEVERRVFADNPHANINGMEVQVYVEHATEAFLGTTSNSPLGATVSVGMGGVLVELLGDAVTALAPLSTEQARKTLTRTRLSKLLSGYRNLQSPVDLDPLVDALVRVSRLADDLRGVLIEADFNPVLIDAAGGATFVDVLLVAREALVE